MRVGASPEELAPERPGGNPLEMPQPTRLEKPEPTPLEKPEPTRPALEWLLST